MSDAPKGLPLSSSRLDQIFPKLTPEQISRVACKDIYVLYSLVKCSLNRETAPYRSCGGLRWNGGSAALGAAETLVTVHSRGEFTGEVNMLSGHRTFVACVPPNLVK